jgi:hypothetical protein
MTDMKPKDLLTNGGQVLKSRDDHAPVFLELSKDSHASTSFSLCPDSSCSWAKADEAFGPEKLRQRIEPWLTALVQSEHLSLLIGSGLTHAVHRLATNKGLPGMTTSPFEVLNKEITKEAERTANAAGRKDGNFEDQIRAASELLRGLGACCA